MAERELRRMSRTELIEIIYALKQHEEELEQQNAALQKQLDDRTCGWNMLVPSRKRRWRCIRCSKRLRPRRCVSGIGEGNESAPAR